MSVHCVAAWYELVSLIVQVVGHEVTGVVGLIVQVVLVVGLVVPMLTVPVGREVAVVVVM